nr:MAG TPA: hypothetical protein [Caudoviricetes sp.]
MVYVRYVITVWKTCRCARFIFRSKRVLLAYTKNRTRL